MKFSLRQFYKRKIIFAGITINRNYYQAFTKILLYRLVDNYEYGSFTSSEAIMQDMLGICGPQKEAVSEVKVGRLVSSIWGNKFVKMKSSSLEGLGYRNPRYTI